MSAMTCIISHLNISGRIKSKPTRKEDYSRWQESDLQSNKRFEQISVLLVHQLMDKKIFQQFKIQLHIFYLYVSSSS
jgi:hypothetical protein